MEALMKFEDVAELLTLDARDKKRNLLFLNAVNEKVALFLQRNLIMDTKIENTYTTDGLFLLKEYPVREILEMIDLDSGEAVLLAEGIVLKDIKRPDAHQEDFLKIAGNKDRNLRVMYRYGYTQEEIPSLIQAKILDMIKERITGFGNYPQDIIETTDEDHLREILPYARKSFIWL